MNEKLVSKQPKLIFATRLNVAQESPILAWKCRANVNNPKAREYIHLLQLFIEISVLLQLNRRSYFFKHGFTAQF